MEKTAMTYGLMLDDLILKLSSWNKHDSDSFHNNSTRDDVEGRYLWENTDSGVFLWRDVNAFFFRNDGKVYKLSKWWDDNAWIAHNRLYEQCYNTDCRIEIPLYNKKVDIDGVSGMYYELQRPGNELGTDIAHHTLNNKIDTNYMLQLIDDTAILLNNLKVINLKYDCKLPDRPPKRLLDTTDYFWSDFKMWDKSFDEYVNESIIRLNKSISNLENNFSINFDRKIIETAINNQWKI